MQKLLGFTPDADPTTPGVLVDCVNLIPHEIGMRGAPTGQTPNDVPALAATCTGAAVVTKLDATRKIFAGTASKLYELSSGAWVDRSKAGGYSGGADSRWSLTQFGDSTLAANGADPIQKSSSGAFASISGAPTAEIVFSVGAFVMALNTIDGAYGTQPDRWWCCASYDDSDWTPSVTTLATTGRLVSAPGPILAGGRLGEYAVVYKQRALYLGQYVGSPSVWDFQQVPGGDAGCVGKNAWCDIGAAHFFVGTDNLYVFDGTRPQAVGIGAVRNWFFSAVNPVYLYKIQCVYDRKANAVWIFYPSEASTVCDEALVYHLATQQWGRATLTVEAALDYISSGATIDGMDSISATIDGLSSYSFDSQYWISGGRSLSVVNSSHQLQLLSGNTVTSGFTTGDIGDDETVSLLQSFRVRFAPGYTPTSATANFFTKMEEGAGLTVGGSATMTESRFDVLQSARFHRAALTFTGPVRIISVGGKFKPGGVA